jgi:hypothetical protein
MLEYALSEMRSADGAVLWYEAQKEASGYAVRLSQLIARMPIYGRLAGKFPSPRPLLYFQFAIRKEIYPFILQACVIKWHQDNGRRISPEERVVTVPMTGVFILLKDCWDFNGVPLKFKTAGPSAPFMRFGYTLKDLARDFVKERMEDVNRLYVRFRGNSSFAQEKTEGGDIACHYAEGVDPSRRSDLNWYPGSGVDPNNVLIYFDTNDYKAGKPIDANIIKGLEAKGFRWVALKKDIIEGQGPRYWKPRPIPRGALCKKRLMRNEAEKWIVETWNRMMRQVYYWRSFYDDFDIKIHYITEEGVDVNISQAIAFDIGGESAGALVGKQRSEIIIPIGADDTLGYHPKHIFFVWNKRAESYIRPNYEQIETLITTGYPYDISRKSNISQTLRSKGVKFVVTLLDGVHGPDVPFSTTAISRFYRFFLEWALNDPTVGLIVKSKKPRVLKALPAILLLLDKATQTGRCVRMENEWGMFPSEASAGSDIAVGCGIGTAIIETALKGCRGIHYDMTNLRRHEFYSWGYEKIIFDDLDRLMAAIKRYKENHGYEPNLGDWSPYMDKLDAFRDGKGHERMGTYMRWLLEAFEEGKGREEAMRRANGLYAARWGDDKIIDMKNERQPEEIFS